MSLRARTLVSAVHLGIPPANGMLVARLRDFVPARGIVYALVIEETGAVPNIYAFDLASGACNLVWRGVQADGLLGVLDGVPVAVSYAGPSEAWLVTQPEHRVAIEATCSQAFQTDTAIWCQSTALRPRHQQLFVVNGRLEIRRLDVNINQAFNRRLDEACTNAIAMCRLPSWCQFLRIRHQPVMAIQRIGPESSMTVPLWDAVHDEVLFNNKRAIVDGQTGALVWSHLDSLRVLAGAWGPNVAWTPATHAVLAPADRARALALLICLRQHACRFPQRLALRVIACVMDA